MRAHAAANSKQLQVIRGEWLAKSEMDRARRRKFAALALLLALTAGVARPQEKANQATEEATREVLKVDDQFNQAIQSGNIPVLQKIMADDLTWIARGERLNKSQMIADTRSQNLHFKSLTHNDVLVKIIGNTAIMSGHSTSVLEYKGKLSSEPRLFTNVYMKIDGRWQLVSHHVSDLPKP